MADAQDGLARSSAYPHLSANAGYNRNLKDSIYVCRFWRFIWTRRGSLLNLKLIITMNLVLKLFLTQNVFNFSVFNAIKAAKQYEELSNHVYDATLKGVINGSKKAFYQTLLLKERV